MNPRSRYFKARRRKLRNQQLCTRCGESLARPGHATCTACAAIKLIKDEDRRKTDKAKAVERLRRRLSLLQEGNRLVDEKLQRLMVD